MYTSVLSLLNTVHCADALAFLRNVPDECADSVVTSPPYLGLRDYGVEGQIDLEASPQEYVQKLTVLFREVRRVLKPTGTLWLNLGDSYSAGGRGAETAKQKSNRGASQGTVVNRWQVEGFAPKNLLLIPARVAIALQDDGWIVRSDIVWSKPNPMPESVKDRPTKSHEYVFLLTKSQQYFYDAEAVAEPARYDGRKDTRMKGSAKYKAHCVPGAKPQSLAQSPHERWRMNEQGERIRNARSVWEIATQPNGYAHFATMPQKLAERCILAGCPDGGVVLDPFMGSGTTALAARKLKRNYIGIELNPEYVALANRRLSEDYTVPLFA